MIFSVGKSWTVEIIDKRETNTGGWMARAFEGDESLGGRWSDDLPKILRDMVMLVDGRRGKRTEKATREKWVKKTLAKVGYDEP